MYLHSVLYTFNYVSPTFITNETGETFDKSVTETATIEAITANRKMETEDNSNKERYNQS
jgi:hypothetical protein